MVSVLLGAIAYILGGAALFVGLQTGGGMFSDLHPRSYDAMYYFWIVILTCGAAPGLGTAIVFYAVAWVLRKLLRQSPDAEAFSKGIAMLVALSLTFLIGVYLAYDFAQSL